MSSSSLNPALWVPLVAAAVAAAVAVVPQAADDSQSATATTAVVGSEDSPVVTPRRGSGTAVAQATKDGGFGDGTWTVGNEVEPGLYASTVPRNSPGCSWERIEDFQARYDTPIAGNDSGAEERVVVEIAESDAGFRSSGCGKWRPYSSPSTAGRSIESGMWLVGRDILPGRYRSQGPLSDAAPCEWARQIGFSDSFFDIVQSDQATGPVTIRIEATDVSFASSSCAEWKLVDRR